MDINETKSYLEKAAAAGKIDHEVKTMLLNEFEDLHDTVKELEDLIGDMDLHMMFELLSSPSSVDEIIRKGKGSTNKN